MKENNQNEIKERIQINRNNENSFPNLNSNNEFLTNIDYRQVINITNALEELKNKIEFFFMNNKIHQKYLTEASFGECSNINNRFCKFCFLKKVNFL